jgi:ABC-type sugar transport system permease subunit
MAHPSSPLASQRRFAYAGLTPIMLYMMVFSLFPMAWAIALSLFDYAPQRAGSGLLGLGGANPFVGLQNYLGMLGASLEARAFRQAIVNTFLFSFLVLPLNLAITLPLAVLIENVHSRMKGFFRAIYFLPVISTTVAVALIWSYFYHPQWGLLNNAIRAIGLAPPRAWLTDPRAFVFGIPLALVSVMIAYLWQDFGYNLVLFVAALQGIPQSIREAARVDGASAWHEFWHITLPLLRPTLLFVCVLTMLSSFQTFTIFRELTAFGDPQNQTLVLVTNIYQNAFRFQRMGWAAAMSMVLFLVILALTVFQFRFQRTDWEY